MDREGQGQEEGHEEVGPRQRAACVAGPEYPTEPSITLDDPPVARLVVDEPVWLHCGDGRERRVEPPGATLLDYRDGPPETGVSRLWLRQAGEERAYCVVLTTARPKPGPSTHLPPPPEPEVPPGRADIGTRFTARKKRQEWHARFLGSG